MKMSIKQFAEMAGVSVRTLHYYDEIGLLSPDYVESQNGYRFYGENALERMQEILFYRELHFPLKAIADIVSSPDYDKKGVLDGQKKLLILKKQRLERIIRAIEDAQKGEKKMDFNAFDKTEFEKAKTVYKEEAKARWGDTQAFKESEQKTSSYGDDKWEKIGMDIEGIISEFSDAKKSGKAENSEEAISLAKKLQVYITETQYTCTDEILLSLGEMYISDERFKKNIDRHGIGTAEYISRAIKAYCG